jgi:hypothetical protein
MATPVKEIIIQAGALSWAATQIPEITVAIQSFLKARFLNAVHLKRFFMIRGLNSLQRQSCLASFRNFVPKQALTR